MKLTNSRTNHLLVRASSNSEWDTCRYAIIDVSDGYMEKLNAIAETVQETVGKIDGMLNTSILDGCVEFYTDIPFHLNLTGPQWYAFIEDLDLDDDEFILPESRLDCHQVRIGRMGGVYWLAYGKYTSGEEFFTEGVNIFDLITIK
jgi:hypothetical protein